MNNLSDQFIKQHYYTFFWQHLFLCKKKKWKKRKYYSVNEMNGKVPTGAFEMPSMYYMYK